MAEILLMIEPSRRSEEMARHGFRTEKFNTELSVHVDRGLSVNCIRGDAIFDSIRQLHVCASLDFLQWSRLKRNQETDSKSKTTRELLCPVPSQFSM